MSYSNGPRMVREGLYFYSNSLFGEKYYNTGENKLKDSVSLRSLSTQGFQLSETGFFNVSNNSAFSAISYAQLGVFDYSFVNSGNVSAFVNIYNTGDLEASAASYFRQVAFSCGTDSQKGAWAFERGKSRTNMQMRYKWDQEPTYGSTISLGYIPYSGWTQIGFTSDTETLKVYVNGEMTNSTNISSKTISSPSIGPKICIGAASNGSPIYGFLGYVSNACFYKQALSEADIRTNYQALKWRGAEL